MIDIRDYYTSNFPEGRENTLWKYLDRSITIAPDIPFESKQLWDILETEFDKVRVRTLAGEILINLKALGYIIYSNKKYLITDKGLEAKLAGGHYRYIEALEAKKKKEKEKEELEVELLKTTIKQNQYLYKTRWYSYVISFIAFAISIIAILVDCSRK